MLHNRVSVDSTDLHRGGSGWGIRGTKLAAKLHVEGKGKELGKGHDARAVRSRERHRSFRKNELGEHLAASAARRTGGVVEVDDGDGCDANAGSELGDRSHKRRAFRADGQAVADIFNVGSSDDRAVGERESRAHAKSGIRRIRIERRLACRFLQRFERLPIRVRQGHDVPQPKQNLRLTHGARPCTGRVGLMIRSWQREGRIRSAERTEVHPVLITRLTN